jgi:hypothetical protein
MDIDKLFDVNQVPDSLFDSVNNTVSEARAMQKKKAAENAQAVIQALQKMKGDLEGKYDSVYSMLESRIASIQDGRDGIDGRDGVNGRDGKNGKDGLAGRDGRDGVDGINGLDGADGISIADIRLDFDNSLVITLSTGREINAGEILPPDITDRLKIIINQGANGAGGGGASLPDQTGNSGKFLSTDGTNPLWSTPSGSGDVVGPASATDNAIVRFNATTGKSIQNSVVTVSDTGSISGITDVTHTSMAAPSYAEGRVWYDTDQKSLAFYNDSTLSPVYIGENIVLKVYNNTGATIAKGAAVYIQSGGSFTYPNVALAKADAVGTSAVIGLMNAATPTGNFGYVTSTGVITGVSTGSMTEGTILYLSPYSAGQLMNTVPATGYVIQVGVVAHSNTPNGTIYTKQTTPLAISAATITGTLGTSQGGTGQTSFTNGQLLIGNSTGNTLSKATLTAGSNITITNSAGAITIAASGGGGSSTILENEQVISSDYTISSAKNGLSVGPVTVNTGIAVTVGTGQKWLVLN